MAKTDTKLDGIPHVLGAPEMCQVFNISKRTFFEQQHKGFFKQFELPQPVGSKRYSGAKVRAFLESHS